MTTGRCAALLLVIGVLGGCGSDPAEPAGEPSQAPETTTEPETFDASGVLRLTDGDYVTSDVGDPCQGLGGFSDMHEGAPVTVLDASGQQVGLGELGPGRLEKGWTCAFGFTVPGIPSADTLFSIEVAGRGGVTFGEAEAHSLSLNLD